MLERLDFICDFLPKLKISHSGIMLAKIVAKRGRTLPKSFKGNSKIDDGQAQKGFL